VSRERLKGWECVSRQNERGDLLVFLSGLNEITALAEPMREYARETKKSPPPPLPSY
jgi:HrpA-like RNA helicase